MSYMRLLESKRVDGLIVAVTLGNHAYLRSWPTHRLPLVGIDRIPSELGIDAVLLDNVAAAAPTASHPTTPAHVAHCDAAGPPRMLAPHEPARPDQTPLSNHRRLSHLLLC